ncbi:MAG: hypothetical protein M1377_02040 [Deltaproteobacteria bacterium]|nr:hypothetical protein [Deltaproteobacteria bacterium]
MAESLLAFVLTRLDQVVSPVFHHRELERFPPEQLKVLLSEGLLRETSKATEVPRPSHLPGGGDLIVRRTAKGLFGVADEDDYLDPVPLTEDDVRQYEVQVSKLIDFIRRGNDIKGVSVKNKEGFFLVGERLLPGRNRAVVYLSLVNGDISAFMMVCKDACSIDNHPVVMLVPRPVPLTVDNVQLLSGRSMSIVPLTTYLTGEAWKLPWDQILRKPTGQVEKEEAASSVYCRAITREGASSLDKDQYEKIVKSRNKYDMFIDGLTREAICKDSKGKPRGERLSPKEFGMLADFISTAKPMRPYSTRTGRTCASASAACRNFIEARRKVDLQLSRFKYRAFRLHKDSVDPEHNTHEFAPPSGLSYCLILPA